jgi:large conductance mechanosensitive channel
VAILKEFREFTARGNVIDLAVGVIIGAAFGKIVTSAVNDLITPPLGMLLGRINFADLFVALDGRTFPSLEAAKAAGAPVVAYGQFLNTVVEFLIVAAVIFLMIRQINRLKTPAPAPPTDDSRDCPFCFSRIAGRATRCPHCTAEIRPASAMVAPARGTT